MSRIENILALDVKQFNAAYNDSLKVVKHNARKMKAESAGIGDSMSQGLSKVTGALGTLGVAVGAAGIAHFFKETFAHADKLQQLSVQLGESAESIQVLDKVGQRAAGVGIEELMESLTDLEERMSDSGSADYMASLDALGVSAEKLAKMTAKEKIFALAEGFKKARDEGGGMKAVMDLMSDQGRKLIPLLESTNEQIDALFENAEGGQIISNEDIARAAELNDQFDNLIDNLATFGKQSALDLTEYFKIVGESFDVGWTKATQNSMDRETARLEAQSKKDADQKARRESQSESFGKSSGVIALEKSAKTKALKDEKDAAARSEKVSGLKHSLEEGALSLLPDDQQIEYWKKRMQAAMDDLIVGGPISVSRDKAGMESLAKLQEQMGNKEGAAEALEVLKEVQAAEQKILDIQEKSTDAEKARAKELEASRAAAEKARFDLLDPKEQERELKKQLGKSLGVDFLGLDDLESGLKNLRDKVAAAKQAGDAGAEIAANAELQAVLEKVGALQAAAGRLAGTEAERTVDVSGTVAGLIEQMKGGDPTKRLAEASLDESKKQRLLLEKILKVSEMDPLESNPLFTQF